VFKEPRTSPEQFKNNQLAYSNQEDSDQRSAVSNQLFSPLEKGGEGGFEPEVILVASNGPLDGLLSQDTKYYKSPSPLAGEGWGEGDPFTSNRPNIQTDETSLSKYMILVQASNPPTSADLAETIEVQFSPLITAKAVELGNNPVKIYNWVRNNIEFVPTYGSIQGADYCLQTKLCNAFDTSSLLISLLRASNIPARYVEGTVEIPIEKVKNWLGGFTDSYEALSLLTSGGIPTIGMTVGGKIKYVRIEHVWVEAWIDYIPSRGARHTEGDTWIPLNASFKQYNYTQGIDIQTAIPFDAQTFIDLIQATATINETEGYVTSVDSLIINQTMTDYQTQVEDYITQNYPDATVGDVLGTKDILPHEFTYLLGTLPYRTIVRGTSYADIPDTLRHKISFRVVKDLMDELSGTPINITKSLPELAGKKLTLSYSPATAADEAVINSYLPAPHADGTPIDPSELPASLDAYLINLKPELKIDGVTVATGSQVGMGATEEFTMTFSGPNVSNDLIKNNIEAGEYIVIGLDLGRISEEQMLAIKTKLEDTKLKLGAQNFTNLTKDDILGDLLYTTAVSYYAELDVMDHVQAGTMGVSATRLPSEALFSYEMKVSKFMGTPLSVSAGGLAMDVDRAMVLVKALDADPEKPKQFMLSSGMNMSALEHSVPEQMFSTPTDQAQGISSVKALKIANDQGIPIYTIDQTNFATIIPQLQMDAGTISDIQNAVNAGKTVTVSQSDITFNDWTGVGYIIIDPDTGAGAYMISGGTNGAWILLGTLAGTLAMFGIILMASTILLGAPALLALFGAILVGLSVGVVLSQLIPDNLQIRTLINEVLQTFISGILAGTLFALLPFISMPTMILLLIALLIALFLPYNDLGNVNIRKRRHEYYFV